MAKTRWTDGGPDVGDRILSRRDVDEWLTWGEGATVLHDAVEDLPMNRLFGEQRARRRLFGVLGEMMNQDDRLRRRLVRSLGTLPLVIHALGRQISSEQLRVLVRLDAVRKIVAVPRGTVCDAYVRQLAACLGGLPDVTRYEGFSRSFLRCKAAESEREFFRMVQRQGYHSFCDPRVMISGVNAGVDWNFGSTTGHYFLGETAALDLSREDHCARFRDEVRAWMKEMSAEFGAMPRDSIVSISKSLRSMTNRSGC